MSVKREHDRLTVNCLNSTLFTFQGRLYSPIDGIAMRSPVSPIVANIFMSNFKEKILSTYTPSPKVWCRFVDDTFVILKQSETETFFEFLDNQCSFIKFTMELEHSNGILCFWIEKSHDPQMVCSTHLFLRNQHIQTDI